MEQYRKSLQRQLSASDSFDSHADSHPSDNLHARAGLDHSGEFMSELTHSDLLGSASSAHSSS